MMGSCSWSLVFILCVVRLSQQWSALDIWLRPLENSNGGKSDEQRVLNFFPVPVEEECLTDDKRRRGTCMNTYECRIQQGTSHGPCALGFGVCCVFTATCGNEVGNNLTYVTSPGFPNLIDQPMNCSVVIKKIEPQVSQLRIDFLHFNIGQPNKRTGGCDEDIMEITSGDRIYQLCGWNSGQHSKHQFCILSVYVDVSEGSVTLDFILPSSLQSRMWEMSIVQLPFEQRAPAGCLQYFNTPRGTLRTLNYLPNGRYLSNQDYLLCIRQEREMCSIAYSPCSSDSFRIGPSRLNDDQNNQMNPADGSGAGSNDPNTVRRCDDRVLIPCDFEEFITPGNDGTGVCDLEHCGTSLCGPGETDSEGNCRVETSATPFHIRVAFGAGNENFTSMEDMIGMCINYEQLPCLS
uniref:CUBN_4 protein n=1 Tax=Fopius arisanus TaxID=64838 RepID=A0A0C9Q2N7_9HYME